MDKQSSFKRYWREYLLGALLLSNIFVWILVAEKRPDNLLKVHFLDVGQGDAILIDSPSRNKILIDGGRNRQVLSQLSRAMSFNDRNIDVVIGTHPDTDHIGGLPEVLSRYKVGLLLTPGVESNNSIDDELEKRAVEKGVSEILARRGMVLDLGDGVKLMILFPNQDVSNWETNRASIVARLEYGDVSFLLTGDSPIDIENVLMKINPAILDVDVLKAGHHGSRTSTSKNFAEAVTPEYVVISASRDNSYGHPHQEVLNNLASVGAKVLTTFKDGTIKFESDGETLKVK